MVGAVLAWLAYAADLTRHASLEGMRALIEAYHPYGPLTFMAVCVAGMQVYVPPIVLIAVGGMLFQGVHAFAYAWLGMLLGATATFVLVRYFARDHFQRMLARRFARLRTIDERLERNGFSTVLGLRLVLFLAPPLNWALAATRVRACHYVGATALGIVPGVAATVFFADTLTRGDGNVFSPRVLAAVGLLVALVAAAAVAGRRVLGAGRPA
jgi:uncharacterized membrane protein YdjX (TVP38/TMEM64 family)